MEKKIDICPARPIIRRMYCLADTGSLADTTYGVWGIIMFILLLGLVCYNAWQDDADERRKGYYVLACALVLGVIILLGLHFWQVDPMDILRSHHYFSLRHGRVSYSYMLFLALGWVALSWFIGGRIDAWLHPEDEEDEEN